jgi:phosphatidylserine/phosphatidylglycerophosphate/cardiolipin synthase-like enzyme
MHNKFVVLLQKDKNGAMLPVSVWTGSTNWTEGAIYGQLNVGHAIDDPGLASKYDQYFQMLFADKSAADMKTGTAALTPVPNATDPNSIPHGITPIFSPQSSLAMIDLYAAICKKAKLLFVSAPFLLHERIRNVIEGPSNGAVRFMMADKEGSFGKTGAMQLMQRDSGNITAVATILSKPLNDFQGKLLEHAESFHHAGVHVHSKIIAADPFSSDPILVTGSANFSTNSTQENDSNSLIIRGDTATTDIYATEFMRMFEHYWFRSHQPAVAGGAGAGGGLSLKENSGWSDAYYTAGSSQMLDRQAFGGLAT